MRSRFGARYESLIRIGARPHQRTRALSHRSEARGASPNAQRSFRVAANKGKCQPDRGSDRMPVTSRPQTMVRNIDPRRAPRTRLRMVFAVSLLIVAGCATSSSSLNPFGDSKTPQEQAADIDPMLQAAGFSALPATTPAQEARLQALPTLKLGYYDDAKGVRHYWLADPD